MADAVFARASAALKELAFSPSTKWASSISAVAVEDAVRSVSFLLGGTVIRLLGSTGIFSAACQWA